MLVLADVRNLGDGSTIALDPAGLRAITRQESILNISGLKRGDGGVLAQRSAPVFEGQLGRVENNLSRELGRIGRHRLEKRNVRVDRRGDVLRQKS